MRDDEIALDLIAEQSSFLAMKSFKQERIRKTIPHVAHLYYRDRCNASEVCRCLRTSMETVNLILNNRWAAQYLELLEGDSVPLELRTNVSSTRGRWLG